MDIDLIIPKLITNVAILFVMMIPGIVVKKLKMIPEGFGKGVSNLVLNIAQPALILFAYLDCDDRDILEDSLIIFLLSFIIHIIFSVTAMCLFKKYPDGKRRLLRLMTVFSNAAFMGIPLISAIYAGTPYAGRATIYASIYNITFNLFLWSLGVFICTNGRDDNNDGVLDPEIVAKKNASSPLKALYHPATIAAVLGITALALNLKNTAPLLFGETSILNDSLEMLKGLVAPLSMVVIGIRLADINFKGFFNDSGMYLCLALRHIILPAAAIGVIALLKAAGLPISNEVFFVTLILAATPAASSATMFAEKFDCDAMYTSRVVTASTILSIATMPAVLLAASFIIGLI